ncbi:MAG: histidinol-phosphate transaminase [Calditrichaeota bacterium]|nr:histidinol-phosphate transaminase [Calditrichota bacterium]
MATEYVREAVRALPGYQAPATGSARVKLDQNESPFDLPEDVKEEVLRRLRSKAWNRYPVYENPALRQKLAAWLGVDADALLLGHGSNQILYALATAILRPGDRLVLSPPTFSLFDLVGRTFEARIQAVPQEPDFRLNSGALAEAATSARLTLLCSPNNPTGAVLDLNDLDLILGKAGGVVLWDEAYHEFWGKTALPLLARHPNLFILRTFSKAYGLAGVRLGYLVGNPDLVAEIRKVNLPYNVDTLSETVLEVVLEQPDYARERVRAIVAERERLRSELQRMPGVSVFPSQANFLLLRFVDGERVYQELLKRGVFVRSFLHSPGLEGCLRVTVGTREQNQVFLDVLAEILSKTEAATRRAAS